MNLSDEILSAIKFAIERQNIQCDKTFKSVVKRIDVNGLYVINDTSGVERSVKCAIPNASINVGKCVWVKIPSGNIANMHICGLL